jgi:hypothetical protein
MFQQQQQQLQVITKQPQLLKQEPEAPQNNRVQLNRQEVQNIQSKDPLQQHQEQQQKQQQLIQELKLQTAEQKSRPPIEIPVYSPQQHQFVELQAHQLLLEQQRREIEEQEKLLQHLQQQQIQSKVQDFDYDQPVKPSAPPPPSPPMAVREPNLLDLSGNLPR